MTIKGAVASKLLFVDSAGETLSNTVFEAEVESITEQRMLRLAIGNRWTFFNNKAVLAWYLGFSKPLFAESLARASVKVRNSQASDPSEAGSISLSDAEQLQADHMRDRANSFLGKYDSKTLPLLGLSLGLRI